jgi:tRNA A-37 threonylcarbamoyl transferase component Bud32
MSGPREPERTRRCAHAVGEALGRFHACGGQHADLHAGNILLRDGDGDGDTRAWVIDLDKARCNMFPVVPRHSELNRLARSLEKRGVLDSIDHSMREIFIEAYKTALKTRPRSVAD